MNNTGTDRKQYVVGFYFVEQNNVVLIRKLRPEWQAGKLNGVGGLVEPGESPQDAMVREFREEAGKAVPLEQWNFFAVLRCADCDVHFFCALGVFTGVQTATDERIEFIDARELSERNDILPNLRWLIPLALNCEPSVVIHQ